MPKSNDLEGPQDMGGKHGGQAGIPKREDQSGTQQGIVRDETDHAHRTDKARAEQVGRRNRGDSPPG